MFFKKRWRNFWWFLENLMNFWQVFYVSAIVKRLQSHPSITPEIIHTYFSLSSNVNLTLILTYFFPRTPTWSIQIWNSKVNHVMFVYFRHCLKYNFRLRWNIFILLFCWQQSSSHLCHLTWRLWRRRSWSDDHSRKRTMNEWSHMLPKSCLEATTLSWAHEKV